MFVCLFFSHRLTCAPPAPPLAMAPAPTRATVLALRARLRLDTLDLFGAELGAAGLAQVRVRVWTDAENGWHIHHIVSEYLSKSSFSFSTEVHTKHKKAQTKNRVEWQRYLTLLGDHVSTTYFPRAIGSSDCVPPSCWPFSR